MKDDLRDQLERLSAQDRELLELLLAGGEGLSRSSLIRAETRAETPYPLSFAQQRMWFLNLLDPQTGAYNMSSFYRLTGSLDIHALERSLEALVQRHASLRTVYTVQDDVPQQIIREAPQFSLPVVNLTRLTAAEREAAALNRIVAERIKPFNLAQDLMLRALLVQLSEEEHILSLMMHHIASDGWSMGIFRRELSELYAACIEGHAPDLPLLPIQYADYAVWQRDWLQGQRLEKQLSFWRRQLSGVASLELPVARPRPAAQSYAGESYDFVLPVELVHSLRILSRQVGATLFMGLLAAFSTLLQRYSGQDDIAIGTVVANRRRSELEGLVGYFLNTLVLRTDLAGDPTFSELLARVRRITLDAYDHQDIPFEKLLEELQPERHLSLTPLFQVLLVLQNMPSAEVQLTGLQVERLHLAGQFSKLDLSLYLTETSNALQARVEYSTDLFDADTIKRMATHFQALLESIVADPNQPISRLRMLPSAERTTVLETWNRTCVDFSGLPDLVTQFYAQVAARPDATAFFDRHNRLTYTQLNERSNRLARYLTAQGVSAGARIGVCLQRSLDVPIALLAIFKLGGVYVPLDPGYPSARLRLIMEDAGVTAVVAETHSLPGLAMTQGEAAGPPVYCLNDLTETLASQPAVDLQPALTTDQTAYIIYTSGSTGRPKGVTVRHRQILNRLAWMWQRYPLEPDEVGCQKTALNFVDSLWELLGYLLVGVPAAVVADDEVRDPRLLVDTLAGYGITHLWLVPSLLRAILDNHPDLQARLPRLRFWVSSGEALTSTLYRRFCETMPDATLYNLYGTSEVWDATWFDPNEPHEPWHGATVPIGRPISNTRTVILDPGGQPVAIGVPGELCVGGHGLGNGYLNLPALTAERFISPPWIGCEPPERTSVGAPESIWSPDERIYRTGDLARWLPDGNIEFLGRFDTQVKVRGHRVELEEIEACLDRHPSVRQSVVVVHAPTTDEAMLVAYVVPRGGAAPAPAEMARFLRTYLPETMIPSRFVVLDQLPLTPSGKVDRRLLPAPDAGDVVGTDNYVPPVTPTQVRLSTIWSEVLGIQKVGIHDRFFDLGGHSLVAIRLFSRIEEEFGQRLPLSLLFRAPTVAQLAEHLVQNVPIDRNRTLVPIQEGGNRAPFFCVHGFGGGVLGYADLANLVGHDRPFYGLQAAGLDGDVPMDTTIEVMASRYIAAMRAIQPHGPYRVGGYCFGGVVAFEMARQLESNGEAAVLVAIMEGYAPLRFQRRTSPLSLQRWQTVWQNIPYWLDDYSSLGVAGLNRLVRRKSSTWRKRFLRRFGVQAEPDVQDIVMDDLSLVPGFQRQLMEAHLRALRAYSPEPIRATVTLYAARGRTISKAVFSPADPEHGWGSLAGGGVEIKPVDGGHRNIHLQPYVSSLAAALAQSLDAVEGDRP